MFLFSEDKVTPLVSKRCVTAREGGVAVSILEEGSPIDSFQGSGEDGAGVEINGGFIGAKAFSVFAKKLLMASSEGGHHRTVDILWEVVWHGVRHLEVRFCFVHVRGRGALFANERAGQKALRLRRRSSVS